MVERARALRHTSDVGVLTSDEASDDPIVAYCERLGVASHRGPLDDVFGRFRAYAVGHRCDWILRLSADSPLLDVALLQQVVDHQDRDRSDLITTIFPRSFPRGQNGELLRVSCLLAVDARDLTVEDREHVTPFFYRHPDRFRIVSIGSGDPGLAERSVAVDTIEDLRRLEETST